MKIVLFTWRAGQQGAGAVPVTPSAGQARQASAQHIGREMLGGNARLAAGPSFADVVKTGQDHVAQDGLDRETGQQPVQHRLRP